MFKKLVFLILLIFMIVAVGYVVAEQKQSINQEVQSAKNNKTIKEVIDEHTKELLSIPGVTGVGESLCDDNPCVLILVIKDTPELETKLPAVLDGYKVKIEETGKIKP